jgi:hypothetical protein
MHLNDEDLNDFDEEFDQMKDDQELLLNDLVD